MTRAGTVTELPGIGKTIEEKLNTLLDTGSIPSAEKLKAKYPPGLVEITGEDRQPAHGDIRLLVQWSIDDQHAVPSELGAVREVAGLEFVTPVGLAAGIMGGITNAPGTAIALYFVALGMDKKEFVRSIAFTFLVVKTVQLVTLVWYGLLTWHLVLGSLGLAALGLAGFALGLRLQDRLDQRSFNRAVLVFLAVLGVWLVAKAL